MSAVGNLTTITTDASVTPTTAHLTLSGTQNAVRILTGNTPVGEASFYLYVRINGGQVIKLRSFRFTGRLLRVGTGASLSFGTSDGRQITVCGCTLPRQLEIPDAVTGTANTDASGPPIWSPAAAHVELADDNQAIEVEHTSACHLFVSESDGSTWSPLRHYYLPANTPITIRCTYRDVALATYSGEQVSVAAPTGATIGGTSANATFGITATGTTRNVSANDEADFRAKIALAVAGDEIVLPAGTYTLTAAILATTFSANNGTNKGGSGVIIRGGTGDRDDVVIQLNTGVDQFNINNSLGTLPMLIKDLTIDCTTSDSAPRLFGGVVRLENVRIFGPQTGSQVYPLLHVGPTSTGPQDFKALDVLVENGLDDGVSGVASGASAQLAATSIVFIRSTSQLSGTTNDNMQCWTTHDELPIELWGCTGSDARLNVIATGSGTGTQYFCFFSTFTPGARRSGMRNSSYYFCDWTGGNAADDIRVKNGGSGYMIGCRLTNASLGSTNQITTFLATSDNPQTGTVIANLFTGPGSAGRGVFTITGGAEVAFNVFTGLGEAYRNSNYSSGSTGPTLLHNNSITSSTTAMLMSDNTTSVAIYNGASRGSTTGINVTTGQMANIAADYNVIDPTVDSDYVAGANDVVSGDAAFSTTTYFPTDAGNCDDTGSPTLYDWVGGIDLWGLPTVYKSGVSPRGARSSAEIRAGQKLYPDAWVTAQAEVPGIEIPANVAAAFELALGSREHAKNLVTRIEAGDSLTDTDQRYLRQAFANSIVAADLEDAFENGDPLTQQTVSMMGFVLGGEPSRDLEDSL